MNGPYLLMNRIGWRGAALSRGAFMVLAPCIGGGLGRDILAIARSAPEGRRL